MLFWDLEIGAYILRVAYSTSNKENVKPSNRRFIIPLQKRFICYFRIISTWRVRICLYLLCHDKAVEPDTTRYYSCIRDLIFCAYTLFCGEMT